MKKIIKYLNEEIKKEKNLIIFILATFIIGLIVGSLFVNFITKEDKILLINQVDTYFSNIKVLDKKVFGINAFLSNLLNNELQVFLIFALGLSILGIPVVILIMFFKGFMLGVTLSTFILKFQLLGVLSSLLYIFPCFIIYLIIYIFISFFAVNTSLKFLKAIIKKDNLSFKNFLGKYLLCFLICLILIIINTLIDAYLTPLLLKLFTYII